MSFAVCFRNFQADNFPESVFLTEVISCLTFVMLCRPPPIFNTTTIFPAPGNGFGGYTIPKVAAPSYVPQYSPFGVSSLFR